MIRKKKQYLTVHGRGKKLKDMIKIIWDNRYNEKFIQKVEALVFGGGA